MSKLRRIKEFEKSPNSYSAQEANTRFGSLPIINDKIECPVLQSIVPISTCASCGKCYGKYAADGGEWVKCASAPNDMSNMERVSNTFERVRKSFLPSVEEEENAWEKISGATRYEQKPFVPTSEEDLKENYTNYDISRKAIKRVDGEYDSDEMHSSNYSPYLSYEQLVYKEEMQNMLLAQTEQRIIEAEREKEKIMQREANNSNWQREASEWANARLKNRDKKSIAPGYMSRPHIKKVSHEIVSDSSFGMDNSERIDESLSVKSQNIQGAINRREAIQRPSHSNEERRKEIFTQDKLKSTSMQEKGSSIVDRLSELIGD